MGNLSTKLRAGLWTVLVGVSVQNCGVNAEKGYRKIRPLLVSGNYEQAAAHLDEVKDSFYGDKSRLLYYMDKGAVLSFGKRYKESNQVLELAKKTAEDLWTESIGANAQAWLTTDNSLPYQGEDFEKVLIHFVGALNYVGAGDYESARVEARQLTNKLELYNRKYTEQKADAINAYTDDAFARWLSGKLSESNTSDLTDYNDAWIDYKKSVAVYNNDYAKRYRTPLPNFVMQDALRVTETLGADFRDEHDALKKSLGAAHYVSPAERQGMAEIVFLHLNGEAPFKVDKFWTVPVKGEVIRIAFPEFVTKPHRIQNARLTLQGTNVTATTELAQNITAIAIQNLNDHMARIKAKTIARQIAKFVGGEVAQGAGAELRKKKSGEAKAAGAALQLAGAVWNVASAVAEEADKRSWVTLPSEVWVGRLFVPPGTTTLRADYLSNNATVTSRNYPLTLEAGKTYFVVDRTYD